MQHNTSSRRLFYLLITLSVVLVLVGVTMLIHTFRHYNALSLSRQDSQLEGMVQAADAGMGRYLSDFREELRYVIDRRGFLNAETVWHDTGNTDELLSRMQENLVIGHTLIHNMLAIQGKQIFLAAENGHDYYFPDGLEEALQPCFSSDGSMYLAIIEEGQHARYAVLLSMKDWYAELTGTYASDSLHLMLLGREKRVLMHTWQGGQHVNIVDDLTPANCDVQALQHMLDSHTTAKPLTLSYTRSANGSSHDMRMTALPMEKCTNGYFTVCLTSDYDEVMQPMNAAAWRLIISGAMLVIGVLLLLLMAALLAQQNKNRDRELERLIQRNEQTQKLLEKTTELAHHQRLQTIGTLTASIAHEFNNLLTPIMGYSILTLEGLPEGCDDLEDNVSEIYEASRKAKDIISRLNALSRKHEESSLRRLSLFSIAERTLQVAAPALPPRVSSRLEKAGDDCFIRGNETQLSQLLLNLVLNAYHAMETSGGVLKLSLHAEGDQAVIQVHDQGVGIPVDVLPHIFEPFFTTKDSGRGTGLGLAIVQQVVQNHHGEIHVKSKPGQGSTFTVRLPLADSTETTIS